MALSAEQQAVRATGIGGSEVGALVGYGDPFELWARKVHGLERPANDAMMMGTVFEEPILKLYSMLTGRLVWSPGTLRHTQHDIILATPDAISAEPDGSGKAVVEVKCAFFSRQDWGDPGTDEIAEYYRPQVTFEMAVAGIPRTHVVAFFGNGKPSIYAVEYDHDYFTDLRTISEAFWHQHVLTRKPPRMGASEAANRYLKAKYPSNRTEMKPLDSSIEPAIERLRAARAARLAAEAAEFEAELQIKEFLGDAAGVEGEFGRITWKQNRDSKVIDYKALLGYLQVAPEIIEQFTKTKKGNRPFCPEFKE